MHEARFDNQSQKIGQNEIAGMIDISTFSAIFCPLSPKVKKQYGY